MSFCFILFLWVSAYSNTRPCVAQVAMVVAVLIVIVVAVMAKGNV